MKPDLSLLATVLRGFCRCRATPALSSGLLLALEHKRRAREAG